MTIQNEPKYTIAFNLFLKDELQQDQTFLAVYDESETKNAQRIRYGFPDGQIYFLFGNQEQIFRKAIERLGGHLNQQLSKGELITPELMLKETFDTQRWSSNLNTVQLDYLQWFQDYAEGKFNVMDKASATTYKLKDPVRLELSQIVKNVI